MRELTRKERIRMYLEFNLASILSEAKKGYKNSAIEDIKELNGMIRYARRLEDISPENYERIDKLIRAIQRKYKIY